MKRSSSLVSLGVGLAVGVLGGGLSACKPDASATQDTPSTQRAFQPLADALSGTVPPILAEAESTLEADLTAEELEYLRRVNWSRATQEGIRADAVIFKALSALAANPAIKVASAGSQPGLQSALASGAPNDGLERLMVGLRAMAGIGVAHAQTDAEINALVAGITAVVGLGVYACYVTPGCVPGVLVGILLSGGANLDTPPPARPDSYGPATRYPGAADPVAWEYVSGSVIPDTRAPEPCAPSCDSSTEVCMRCSGLIPTCQPLGSYCCAGAVTPPSASCCRTVLGDVGGACFSPGRCLSCDSAPMQCVAAGSCAGATTDDGTIDSEPVDEDPCDAAGTWTVTVASTQVPACGSCGSGGTYAGTVYTFAVPSNIARDGGTFTIGSDTFSLDVSTCTASSVSHGAACTSSAEIDFGSRVISDDVICVIDCTPCMRVTSPMSR
jgi:hypothetical protein